MRKTLTAIAAAVTIAAATIGGAGLASAVTQPAAATRTAGHSLPRWAHWETAPRGACGRGIPGIVVWAGHGDGVLICPDGDVEPS